MLSYVDLSLQDFAGRDIAIEGDFEEITSEMAEKEIRRQQMLEARCQDDDLDTHDGAPGWCDDVYIYYDMKKEPNGQSVASNLFGTVQKVAIGIWEFEDGWSSQTPTLYYTKALSDALQQMQPVARITDRAVASEDWLRVGYVAKTADGKDVSSVARTRTNAKGEGLSFMPEGGDLIGLTPGESRSFTVTEKVNNVDTEVIYTVTVEYIAQESFTQVVLQVPENCFDSSYRFDLQALNGKTVYMDVMLEYYTDFAVPSLEDDKFVSSIISGFSYDAESGVSRYDAIVAAYRQQMIESQKSSIGEAMLNALYLEWQEQGRVKKMPKSEYESYYQEVVALETAAYEKAKQQAGSTAYPYDSVNSYINELTEGLYPTLYEYAKQTAENNIGYRIFLFAVSQLAGIRVSQEEFQKSYDANLEYLMKVYNMTKEEVIEQSGGQTAFENWVKIGFQQKLLIAYLYEHNQWHLAE